jgi:hypothetical protein
MAGDAVMDAQGILAGLEVCRAPHPTLDLACQNFADHEGRHNAAWKVGRDGFGHTFWESIPPLQARHTDPDSSKKAAARDFDIPGGRVTMATSIAVALAACDDWMTCREIAEAIWGEGPYTYEQAVAMNKVQTICLALWRQGLIERQDAIAGSFTRGALRYRLTP